MSMSLNRQIFTVAMGKLRSSAREQMFPVDFGHLCERLRRAQGRGPSTEQDETMTMAWLQKREARGMIKHVFRHA